MKLNTSNTFLKHVKKRTRERINDATFAYMQEYAHTKLDDPWSTPSEYLGPRIEELITIASKLGFEWDSTELQRYWTEMVRDMERYCSSDSFKKKDEDSDFCIEFVDWRPTSEGDGWPPSH